MQGVDGSDRKTFSSVARMKVGELAVLIVLLILSFPIEEKIPAIISLIGIVTWPLRVAMKVEKREPS